MSDLITEFRRTSQCFALALTGAVIRIPLLVAAYIPHLVVFCLGMSKEFAAVVGTHPRLATLRRIAQLIAAQISVWIAWINANREAAFLLLLWALLPISVVVPPVQAIIAVAIRSWLILLLASFVVHGVAAIYEA